MNPIKIVGFALLGITALVTLLGTYDVVNPGERGILITMGKPSEIVLDEGVHLKMPFLSSIKNISVRVQKSEASSEGATKDLQRVGATVALNWNLNPNKVAEMYSKIGDEHDIHERIIKPAVSEVLKSATAKLTAEEILTKRMELKTDIDTALAARLLQYNIEVKDISLVDFNFTKDFNESVEQKQIAEQSAKKAVYVAQQAKADAEATVNKARGAAESRMVEAKAEAEAQRMLQLTVTDKIIQLKAIEKWNGSVPQVMGNGGQMLFNIPTKPTKAE